MILERNIISWDKAWTDDAMKPLVEWSLNHSHYVDVQVNTYDRDEKLVGSLDRSKWAVAGGDVQVNTDQPVPKYLDLQIIPRFRTSLQDLIVNGPFHPAKFIEVLYLFSLEGSMTDTWISVPVFYGLANKAEYDEVAQVFQVQAKSKECLMLPPEKSHRTESNLINVSKETTFRLDHLIKRVAKQHGETKFRLCQVDENDLVDVVKKKLDAFTKEKGVWPYLKAKSRRLGYALYYDREGYLTLREVDKQVEDRFNSQGNVNITFSASEVQTGGRTFYSNMTTMPVVGWDGEKFRNRADVYARKNRNAKSTSLLASYFYDQEDVFGSTTDMARNGVKREITEVITHDGTMKPQRARRLAIKALKRAQQTSQEATFEALPQPQMELETAIRVFSPGKPEVIIMPTQWTLPVLAGPLMSIGYQKRSNFMVVKRRMKHLGRHKRHGGK